MQDLNLLSPVGLDQDNDPEDVSNAATALVALGRWSALEAARSGEHGNAFDREIRSYQAENDLEPDGILLPGGPTQTTLNRALAERPLGPSLLEPASSDIGVDTPAVPRTRRADLGGLSSALESRLERKLGPVHRVESADTDELPRISERTRRTMDAAARLPEKAQAATDLLGALWIASPATAETEQIMIRGGFRYIPDPMGRLGEGDWIDAAGRRLGADDAARIARESIRERSPHVQVARVERPPHGGRADRHSNTGSISQSWRDFAAALDAASHRVALGDAAPALRLPTSSTAVVPTDHDIPRINGALREAVVANALQFRPTTSDEVATIVARSVEDRAMGPQGNRSRIHDMLLAAANNAASPDEKLHARGLLSVYQMEREEAKQRGEAEPSAVADRALTRFVANQSGQVAWSVYRTEEEEDDVDVSEASDDPDNSGAKKPRGMANPKSGEAARDGYRRHEQQLKPYVDQKGPGWRYGEGVKDPKTRTRVYPDVTTPRGRTMEMKPDTPTGRAAGAKQIERYERATNKSSKVFTYREFTTPPRPPNAADEKGGMKWTPSAPRVESGQVGSSGRAPAVSRPALPPRIFGSGGNKLYPKVDKPFYLHRMWEMLE